MPKLKLGTIPDDKPIKLTIELPAAVHRDLVAYGHVLGRETGQGALEPLPRTAVRQHQRRCMRPRRLPAIRVGLGGFRPAASAEGQQHQSRDVRVTSADTPKAAANRTGAHFAFVPCAEVP